MSGRLVTSHFRFFPVVQRASAWKDVLRVVRVVLSRRELLDREPRLLSDVGLTPADALVEAKRAPWDILPPRHRRPGPRKGGVTLLRAVRKAYRRRRSRRQITQLDGRMLKDIGVTFAEAEEEANKPFWRG